MATIAANPIWTKVHQNRGMIFPFAFIGLLAVILVSLPPLVLDLLLICNMTLAVVVLGATIYVQRALGFAGFPPPLLAGARFPLGWDLPAQRVGPTAHGRPPTP